MKRILLVCMVISLNYDVFAEEPKYMGVSTCSSSACHGSVKAKSNTNILYNEYTIWKKHDAHSKAWGVLNSADSKRIAMHLGINDASSSSQCISCHSTYAPDSSKRGKKYQQEDGVSCESCHGPASKWLKSHTHAQHSRSDSLKKGMIDLSIADTRARVCLDCHYGNSQQKVTHELIAAGHPRLTFELDTFSEILPPHWVIDEDYAKRKSKPQHIRFWLVGHAERVLRFATYYLENSDNKIKDFTMYECYSCHHSLEDDYWKKRTYTGKPGSIPENHSSLEIVLESLRVFDQPLYTKLSTHFKALQSSEANANAYQQIAATIKNEVVSFYLSLEDSQQNKDKLLKGMVNFAKKKQYPSYELAEQITMSLALLNPDLVLKSVYKTLENEEQFSAEKFHSALMSIL